jgi:hypothetical protein
MIVDGTITNADLGANSVGASELANNAVTSGNVKDNSLTASDLDADSVGASEIAEAKFGDFYGRGVEVASDGVMEIGRYIDFHDTDDDTSDYGSRISANGATLSISGDLRVAGNIYTGVEKVATKSYVDSKSLSCPCGTCWSTRDKTTTNKFCTGYNSEGSRYDEIKDLCTPKGWVEISKYPVDTCQSKEETGSGK